MGMCAVEQDSGAMARREPQDLSVTVELGLCHCSRLPGNTRLESMMMIWLECALQIKCYAQVSGDW